MSGLAAFFCLITFIQSLSLVSSFGSDLIVLSTRRCDANLSGNLRLYSQHNSDDQINEQKDHYGGESSRRTFWVHVSYDEDSSAQDQRPDGCRPRRGLDIPVLEGETILSALERAAAGASSGRTALSSSGVGVIPPPFDCRRGNCLTCSARHNDDSEIANLQSSQSDNGLSPHVSKRISDLGYILTCCSTVTGPGVSLTLGLHNQIWDFVYKKRWEDDSTKAAAHAAMAKAIRRSAERNVREWAEQTERAYRTSTSRD
ncbi:hypothetical protein ACA910_005901 [Epithemia clementina (nom. ined.)]